MAKPEKMLSQKTFLKNILRDQFMRAIETRMNPLNQRLIGCQSERPSSGEVKLVIVAAVPPHELTLLGQSQCRADGLRHAFEELNQVVSKHFKVSPNRITRIIIQVIADVLESGVAGFASTGLWDKMRKLQVKRFMLHFMSEISRQYTLILTNTNWDNRSGILKVSLTLTFDMSHTENMNILETVKQLLNTINENVDYVKLINVQDSSKSTLKFPHRFWFVSLTRY
ncbi:hypothetical protein D915_004433 [Fasciola hepatica]|uniref:Uncharacterized protein n=1 Tax=Fasciola hepatica TaxID=6192 RepID=A0A4E0RTQ6_FASHE|nr:hypothetical protein D915_004433 [Fasciola hepatica]